MHSTAEFKDVLQRDAPGADNCVDKEGKPLNDCAMNRQRNLLVSGSLFLGIAGDRIEKAVESAAKLETTAVKDFNREAKDITTNATKDLAAASKLPTATNSELKGIADGSVDSLEQLSLETSARLDEILQEATAEVDKEGSPAGLRASSSAYGDELPAEDDAGVAALKELIATGTGNLNVSRENFVEQLADYLQGYCDQIVEAAQNAIAKVDKRRNKALRENERQEKAHNAADKKAAEAQKKQREKEEKQREKEDNKRKAAEMAAAAGVPAKKPRKKAVVKCKNPSCMNVWADGEQGWLKCPNFKECEMRFCPKVVCQQMRQDHENLCCRL
jgi:hypothetical protein